MGGNGADAEISAAPPEVPEDYWRRIFEVEEIHWWHRGMRAISEALLGERLLRGGSLLDVGCGTGGFIAWALQEGRFERAVGVDISAEAVELARRRAPGVELRVATIWDLPFDAGSFDIVTLNDVLQHVSEVRVAESLAEVRRVLSEDGALLVRTGAMLRAPHGGAEWRAYDRRTLRATLEEAGFRCERLTHANAIGSAWAVVRRRTPRAPTGEHHCIPSLEPRPFDPVMHRLLLAEARYLERPSRSLKYGHTLFAVASAASERRLGEFWHGQAQAYDRAYDSLGCGGQQLRARQEAVLRLLDDHPGDVLDAGMGPGRVLAELAERGWRIAGVDLAEGMVEAARRRLPRAAERLRVGSILGLPFPDASFDAAVATGVLEYVDYSPTALAELARILRPGGVAVVSQPSRWALSSVCNRTVIYPAARLLKTIWRFGRPAPVKRPWPPAPRRFASMLADAGLRLEAIERVSLHTVPPPLDRLFPRTAARLARRLEGRAPRRGRFFATQLVYAARKQKGDIEGTGAGRPETMRVSPVGECAACGSRFRFPLYRWNHGLQVWRCSECDLLYTDPLPDERSLIDYYRNLSRAGAEPGHMRRRENIEERLSVVREAFAEYVRVASGIMGTDRMTRILDVGGGIGLYAKAAESLGYEAHCVEIDEGAAQFAEQTLGLKNVVRADARALTDCVEGTFDLVLCRHVIEHVRDPGSLVEQLARATRTGGILLIETPNADNWEIWAHPRVLALDWATLRRENPGFSVTTSLASALTKPLSAATPPKHLYGFGIESLSILLRRFGFEPCRQMTAACGDPVFDPLYYLEDPLGRTRILRSAYRLYEKCASSLVALAGRGSRLAVFSLKSATADGPGPSEARSGERE
jgi:ubiquinone/menaquinone biosynthesis C-methylase UbiE